MNNLSTQAYNYLYQKLTSGCWPGGTKLSEPTLAQEMGISRTPVREAISQLEREGLLEQIPKHGTFVRIINRKQMADLYDFRIQIETYAAQLAAQHIQPPQIEQLQDICQSMTQLLIKIRSQSKPTPTFAQKQKWMQLDAAFHNTILEASTNHWIVQSAKQMRMLIHIFNHWRDVPGRNISTQWRRTSREHRQIIRALTNHNGHLAKQLIRTHIQSGKDAFLQFHDWFENARCHTPLEKLPKSLQIQIQNHDRYEAIQQKMADQAEV